MNNPKFKKTINVLMFYLFGVLLSSCNNTGTNDSSINQSATNAAKASSNNSEMSSEEFIGTKFLFASCFTQNSDGSEPTYDIYTYPLNESGVIGPNSSIIHVDVHSIDQMIVSPDQRFLYAISYSSNRLLSFSISSTDGHLNLISNYPVIAKQGDERIDQPIDSLAIDPSGQFIYVGGGVDGNTLYTFIQQQGLLGEANYYIWSDKKYVLNSLAVDPTGSWLYANTSQYYGILSYPTNISSYGYPDLAAPTAMANTTSSDNTYAIKVNNRVSPAIYQLTKDGRVFAIATNGNGQQKSVSGLPETVAPVNSEQCHARGNCSYFMSITPDNSELFVVAADTSIKMINLDPNTGNFMSLPLVTNDNTPPAGVSAAGKSYPETIITDQNNKYLYALAVDDDIHYDDDTHAWVGGATHLRTYAIDKINQSLTYYAHAKSNMPFGRHQDNYTEQHQQCGVDYDCKDTFWGIPSCTPTYKCTTVSETKTSITPEYHNSMAIATIPGAMLVAPSQSAMSNILLNETMVIDFPAEVNSTTVNPSTVYLTSNGGTVSLLSIGSTLTASNAEFSFIPEKLLNYNQQYTLVVDGPVLKSGMRMAKTSYSLHTRSQNTPILESPSGNGTQNLSKSNQKFVVRFSSLVDKDTIKNENIDFQPSSIDSNYAEVGIQSTTWVESTHELQFMAAKQLNPNTQYNLVVKNVYDKDGGIENNASFSLYVAPDNNQFASMILPKNDQSTSEYPRIVISYVTNLDPSQFPSKTAVTIDDETMHVSVPAITNLIAPNKTETILQPDRLLSGGRVYELTVNNVATLPFKGVDYGPISAIFRLLTREAPDIKRELYQLKVNNDPNALVVYLAQKIPGGKTGYTGNLGGRDGADYICNHDYYKPTLHHGSGIYKALISVRGAVDAKDRYACTASGECGGENSYDWPFKANKRYLAVVPYTHLPVDFPYPHDAFPDTVLGLGRTNEFGIIPNSYYIIGSLAMSTAKRAWTGLNSDWTTADNTCSNWTTDQGNGVVGNVGTPRIKPSEFINSGILSCKPDQLSNYGVICVEQP